MRTLTLQALIGAIFAVAAGQVPAHAAAQQQSRGEIVYITGGVGTDERAQLRNVEKDFNLKLIFTDPGGHLLSDVRVVVKDAAGTPVLEELSGPIFLAKLPPGIYTVESDFNNSRHVRKVTVGRKMTATRFQFRDVNDAEVAMR